MPFLTTYEIQTAGAPIAAYDYEYTPQGIDVLPLDETGIMPIFSHVFIPWENYKGIRPHETRLPHGDEPQEEPAPLQDPEPDPEPDQQPRLSDIIASLKI